MASKSAKFRSAEILIQRSGETIETDRFVEMSARVTINRVGLDRQPITVGAPILGTFGGTWDRLTKQWVGDAKRALMIRLHEGQEEFAREFIGWLTLWVKGARGPHWEGFDRFWTYLLIGGRRSGKTHMAMVAIAIAALVKPGAILWCVSPKQEETDELEEALREILPSAWYKYHPPSTGRTARFNLANGSSIRMISGFKPASLKRGRADLVLLNEAQNMAIKAWATVRPAVADRGGLCLLAANPPDREQGRWVEDTYQRSTKGENKVKSFAFDPARNPYIEYQALLDMESDLNDPITYRREIKGEIGLAIGNVAMHSFGMDSIRMVPPEAKDITREFSKAKLGQAFDFIGGADFQRTPHMPAVMFKIFELPGFADPVAWAVDCVAPENCDEIELIQTLEERRAWSRDGSEIAGYRGQARRDGMDRTICGMVIDASAWWQDGAHNVGKQSDKIMRSRGWVHLFTPQEGSRKNPEIKERVKTANWMLCSGANVRRCFVDPNCEDLIKALRRWDLRQGFPNRNSHWAHLCDAFSYPLFRLFGLVRQERRAMAYAGVNKFTRRDDVAGL